MEILRTENLEMAYNSQTVLKDVSFSINEGDYLCIVGENGSGKTTLLKGILGLVPIKSGKVVFNGKEPQIGYLPQYGPIQQDFPASVYEVVLSGRLAYKRFFPFYNKEDKKIAEKYMKNLGILSLMKRSFKDLSGGQRQRVLLARALCATNKILFLDEPISGLDPLATADMYEILHKLNIQEGLSVVMISHDLSSALKHATKILHLNIKSEFFGTRDDYVESSAGKRFLAKNIEKCDCE